MSGAGAMFSDRFMPMGRRMNRPTNVFMACTVVSVAMVGWPGATASDATDVGFPRSASWTPADPESMRDRTLEWLRLTAASTARTDVTLAGAARIWTRTAESADDPLDAVIATVALVDPRLAALRDDEAIPAGAAIAWLDEPSVSTFQRDAVQLWLGRRLVRLGRYDEALPLLAGLDVATSIDPATLLFHRAACQHWLLDVDAAVETLDRLLEQADAIPVRYERLGRLLRSDVAALEVGSLAHIARRMRDVTRRLDLGRAGPSTRRVQDGVVESLDALIAEMERQRQEQDQQGGGGGGGGGGGSGGAVRPMEDSRIASGRGAGEVRSRDLGRDDGWGALPPQTRDEALQQIGREFPAHYRDTIERYFKRLASDGETP